eukprot:g1806.t1
MAAGASHEASMLKILDALEQHELSGVGWSVQTAKPFLTAVDTSQVPDYADVISRPMDLGTIRQKIGAGGYASPEDFHEDVRLVFLNCYLYNNDAEHGQEVRFLALQLSACFDDLYGDTFGRHVNTVGGPAAAFPDAESSAQGTLRTKSTNWPGGVIWDVTSQQWHAYRTVKRQRKTLGAFETKAAAEQAYEEARRAGSSKYYGVYWDHKNTVWRAEIMQKGERVDLGIYNAEKDAALAVDVAIEKAGMTYVTRNFPAGAGASSSSSSSSTSTSTSTS